PVITLACSGGARMQEGPLGFSQMAATALAAHRHRATGLFHLAYLAHPTTGGVLASWASLAHVTWAMPGALVAFTGPRVAALVGDDVDVDALAAEGRARDGLVDAVVAPDALHDRAAGLLGRLSPARPTRP